jgi:hypothetical protein
MRKIGLIGSILAITLLSACTFPVRYTEVKGSGNLTTESRHISAIDSVVLSGTGNLIIEQGNADALEITADENIQRYIHSDVDEGKLKLGTDDSVNIQPSQDITYHLTVKKLTLLETDGMGYIEVNGLQSDHLDLEVNGAGTIKALDLQANSLNLEISGASDATMAAPCRISRSKLAVPGITMQEILQP